MSECTAVMPKHWKYLSYNTFTLTTLNRVCLSLCSPSCCFLLSSWRLHSHFLLPKRKFFLLHHGSCLSLLFGLRFFLYSKQTSGLTKWNLVPWTKVHVPGRTSWLNYVNIQYLLQRITTVFMLWVSLPAFCANCNNSIMKLGWEHPTGTRVSPFWFL